MINVSAILQIAILAVVLFLILRAAKGSRFGQVLMGVGILAAVMFAFTFILHFDVLSVILRGLLIYLAISTVVIFQPEIRRLLSQVGALGFFEKPRYRGDAATSDFMAEVILSLAARKMGALFAFERGISLSSYEDTGVRLNATFSRELVTTVFTPPLPLHDGGMTIRDGRIGAAHCVFPVSNNPDLVVSGMRHRAAAGLSEETDALVVVVSEETGDISIAHNGRLLRYAGDARDGALRRWIAKAMPIGTRRTDTFLLRFFDRLLKGFKK